MLSDYSDVVNVNDRTNVSGFYFDSGGRKISIGYSSRGSWGVNSSRSSRFPFFRGRRLLLEYKDGSRCENDLHRTTIMSFLCDRDLEVTVPRIPSNPLTSLALIELPFSTVRLCVHIRYPDKSRVSNCSSSTGVKQCLTTRRLRHHRWSSTSSILPRKLYIQKTSTT